MLQAAKIYFKPTKNFRNVPLTIPPKIQNTTHPIRKAFLGVLLNRTIQYKTIHRYISMGSKHVKVDPMLREALSAILRWIPEMGRGNSYTSVCEGEVNTLPLVY